MVQNLLIFDWFSFTTKKHCAEEIIDLIGLSSLPFELTKGARGYQDRYYYGSISVHFNGRSDMGVWVEFSGQGCRTFETFSSLTWRDLFDFVAQNELNVTRLDVAYDDHIGILDIDQIFNDTLSSSFVAKSDYWEAIKSSKGASTFYGSPQSLVRIRIYDKARERNCPDGTHWIRVEMQLRDERAKAYLNLFNNPLMTFGEAFCGVILNYLRFVIPNEDDTNKWRWDMADYWSELVQNAERISIYSSPGIEYNLDRLNKYVFTQSGNAIDCAIQIYGVDEFIRRLQAREVSSNPKYNELKNIYANRNIKRLI